MLSRALYLAAAALLAGAGATETYELSDEEFYQMPPLFHLDQYEACLARRGVYCLGSFDLAPGEGGQDLFAMMQRYSANELANFNHTKLHRGLCVSRRCPREQQEPLDAWFASCVNASSAASYNLTARLSQLQYCERGGRAGDAPLSASERAFAAALATLVALAALSTGLDLILSDQAKKSMPWALAWSLPGGWRQLTAAAGAGPLAALDGLRVLGMACFIVEHVCWLNTLAYLADTRQIELMRNEMDGMLVSNSTLMVQAFFLMSSFLLAHKLLREPRRPALAVAADTILNRIVRMSPSHLAVVWFAGSVWARAGRGPQWAPLVRAEADVCARRAWLHALYLHNVLAPQDKCLIQTWYLAADMQLYVVALALTLWLRGRRWGPALLAVLLAAALLPPLLLRGLLPTYLLHRPEAVRSLYRSEPTFDLVYQSPIGNAPGALAGLLLAHAHHALGHARLNQLRWFRWSAWAAPWLAAGWVAWAPLLAPYTPGAPPAAATAALVASERAVFALLVALALLGALHGVESPVRRVLSWPGWAVPARLSFGALLLHMLINKSLLAARAAPAAIDRQAVILEWFGVCVASYLAALPLALLVELPALRLYRALRHPPKHQRQHQHAPARVDAHEQEQKPGL